MKFSAADLRNLHACVEQSYKNINGSDDAKVLIILQNKIAEALQAMNEETPVETQVKEQKAKAEAEEG